MKIAESLRRYILPPKKIRHPKKLPWEYFQTIKVNPLAQHHAGHERSRWLKIWPLDPRSDDTAQIFKWIRLDLVESLELRAESFAAQEDPPRYRIVLSTSKAQFYACADSFLLDDGERCLQALAEMISRAG